MHELNGAIFGEISRLLDVPPPAAAAAQPENGGGAGGGEGSDAGHCRNSLTRVPTSLLIASANTICVAPWTVNCRNRNPPSSPHTPHPTLMSQHCDLGLGTETTYVAS